MSRLPPSSRADYPHFLAIPTRWMDNDIYGHVNNVVYYSYFDTVINRFLIEAGGLDPHEGAVVGMAVETGCRFHRSLAFPDLVQAGLRIGKLGHLQRALRGRHLPQRRDDRLRRRPLRPRLRRPRHPAAGRDSRANPRTRSSR